MGRKMALHARDLVEFCHTLQTGLQHVEKEIQPVLNSCVMKEGQNHLNFNAPLYTLLLLTVHAAK